MATDAEQAVLARYIGWGHTNSSDVVELIGATLASATRGSRKRATSSKPCSRSGAPELGESTPNAHYSFADLPRAMWARCSGLASAAAASWNRRSAPAISSARCRARSSAHKRTRLWAVEKEPIAAAISRQLYQDAHVQTSRCRRRTSRVTTISTCRSAMCRSAASAFSIRRSTSSERAPFDEVHNYYFGKALDVVRPGGIIAFVTSRYTMDARSDAVRAFLAEARQPPRRRAVA
jgi:hypothetical protein